MTWKEKFWIAAIILMCLFSLTMGIMFPGKSKKQAKDDHYYDQAPTLIPWMFPPP